MRRPTLSESYQSRLSRVRKPRVHITYEVETEGAQIERELPFVVGVLGDFAGDPTAELKPLAERKFVQIDRDNFNDVMARIAPGLNLKVENRLAGDGTEMAVSLKFNSIEDFEPARVAEQVPALKALLDTRAKLRDLLSKVDRSENLEALLEEVLQDKAKLDTLSAELGLDGEAKR
jgi:type VI secretion system protein ImpB